MAVGCRAPAQPGRRVISEAGGSRPADTRMAPVGLWVDVGAGIHINPAQVVYVKDAEDAE